MTTETRDGLAWLLDLLDCEKFAEREGRLTAWLTDEQSARIDAALKAYTGDPVTDLGIETLPADVQATIRRVTEAAR